MQESNDAFLTEIDPILEEFESQLQANLLPKIEDSLGEWQGPQREVLFRNLLELEIDYLIRAKRRIDPATYEMRFPGFDSIIEQVIASIEPAVQTAPQAEAETVLGHHADPGSTYLHPQTEFGRYRILNRLGHGAMGTVYRARDMTLERDVALKIPKISPESPASFRKRFQREAKSAAVINHRNICPVFDFGDVDGQPFITMAFLEGQVLSEYAAKHAPLDPDWVAALVQKLASALSVAHNKSIVHRDLKPSNVMIDHENEPVIMDFGLALQIETTDASRLTVSGLILGTPAYMSPEQVGGEQHLGRGTDIYSLGVILYELLTGKRPFEGSVRSVFAKISTQEPVSLLEHRPDVPAYLAAICNTMMAKNVDDRYASMEQVVEALSSRDESSPVGQATASMSTGTGSPERNMWWSNLWVPIVGVPLLLLVVFAAINGMWSPNDRALSNVDTEGSEPTESDTQKKRLATNQDRFVRSFEVEHFVPESEDVLLSKGMVGVDSFVTHYNDLVRVRFQLKHRSHAMLLAFNPTKDASASIQLCLPHNEETAPHAITSDVYPRGESSYFQLSDGVGQQVFVLIVGQSPLPTFESLRDQIAQLPWSVNTQRGVWVHDGTDVKELIRDSVDRGKVVHRSANMFELLVKEIRATYPGQFVFGFAFPVNAKVPLE